MTLALLVAFLIHPVGLFTILTIGLVGVVVAAGPVINLGALNQNGLQQILGVSSSQVNSFAAGVTTGTIPRAVLTGAASVELLSAATTPGNQTTPTAAQMYADILAGLGVTALPPNYAFNLRITQTGAGTLTMLAGTGVTLGTGTYTVPTNTFRDFVVEVISPAAITIQTTGVGTWS